MRTPRQTVHRWILGISVLVVLPVCLVSLFFVFLPGFLGQTVAAILREKGFRVERLAFERAGLTGSRLGQGGLSYHDQALEWESIGLSYGPLRLLGGRVDEVAVAAPSLRLRIPELPPRGPIGTGSGAGIGSSVPMEEKEPGDTEPVQPGGPGDVATLPIQPEPAALRLHEWIGLLPFTDAILLDGKLALDWRGRTLLEADWESHLKNRPDRFDGEVRAEGGLASSFISLRADKVRQDFSLSAESEIDAAFLLDQLRSLPPQSGISGTTFAGLELTGPFNLQLLAEAEGETPVRVSGEGSLGSVSWATSLSAAPIGLRGLLMRASYTHGLIHLEGNGTLALGGQPVEGGPARFSLDSSLSAPDHHFTSWAMGNASDATLLTGQLGRAGDEHELALEGTVSLSWVNALVNWWQGSISVLAGADPRIEAQLAGSGYVLKGFVRVLIEPFNLALPDDGPIFKGIAGDTRFRVNGLPQTDGIQQLRIESLTTGKVRLDNLLLEWALPTIRHFRMEKVTASLGQGRVVMDPFTADPLEPVVSTFLRFEQIAGGQFLEWLGERRFAIEGTVSGRIGIKWEAGVLHIGEAELHMNSSATVNRLRFSDKSFLEEQFASMAGVPRDLKEPFLATLLSDGIRISDLTLALVPLPESREVALRLKLSGETRSEAMEVPIAGLVINNVISETDLAELLGLFGQVKFLSQP